MGISQADIDALLAPGGDGEADTSVATAPAPSPAITAAPVAPRPLGPPTESEVQRIKKLTILISVKVAEADLTIRNVVTWSVGSIIEFDVAADAELSLMVGHQTIGFGQAVKIGENFGLRIGRLCSVQDRIRALGNA